ncbi:toxin-antitoxin system YwqK family antitoxin [Tenacibaculum sp. M341]|uniref:toxin-antitoxin system YwqK family antitoxin n=1 Tax=Tenacibaculum sp. M341 TaxID=2530339 RepID=UPI0010539603|nr:hypothetical protein [Tenacibaculum sp. M341]TCI85257.1 hypothetical protein EYW44_17585 [Tenacibaculum sp. M341]
MKLYFFVIITFILLLSCKTSTKTEKNKSIIHSSKEIKKEWWDNGQLATEGTYANGKANGHMKWYHENEYLAGEGFMLNDKRDGVWKVYNAENGIMSAEGSFNLDMKHGKWELYYENGALRKKQNWELNTLIDENCWDENGNTKDCE